jgi:ABC-type transport system substrate-binding protein
LQEAGYGDGFSTVMKIPKVTGATFIADSASLIKSHLSEVNIEAQIDEVELGTFIASTILPGNFEMTFFPNLPYDEPDRPLSFYHSRGVTGTGNWTNYTNPPLDKLIDAQAKEFDVDERQKIIYEAQRIMIREHGPQTTLTSGFQYTARWSYVHFPFEFGQEPPADVLPFGCDIWTEKGT